MGYHFFEQLPWLDAFVNASMLLGFQHLVALAMAFYVVSAIDGWRRGRRAPAIGDTVVPASSALGRP